MLLTITTTHRAATDLGYLLHNHRNRVYQFELAFGSVHIFYPEVSEARCTAALLLEVDPIDLVRGRRRMRGGEAAGLLTQYLNDRPYAASSYLRGDLAATTISFHLKARRASRNSRLATDRADS